MKEVFKVWRTGVLEQFPSTREQGKMVKKQILVLQDLAGSYGNSYAVTCLGDTVIDGIKPNDLVVAELRFSIREHDGRIYQDIYVQGLTKLTK